MRSILSSTLLITLILFVVTGCSLKKAEPIKPEPAAKVQPKMQKLEYFGSDAVAVNIPPKSLEEEMIEAPSAVGEFQPVLSPQEAAAQITQYALQARDGNRSLPLFAHWDTGARSDIEGMSPEFMLSLVEQGHHALVAWELDPYWASYIPPEYYERSIKRAAELKLPLVLVAGSFALPLLEDSSYAKQKNILIGGALGPKGATKTWQVAGKKWMQSELMQKLQEWYPNPPLVVFLSRSEAPHASAASAGMSNKAYGDAWFERYRALHTGMKSALRKEWSANTIFVGRNTFANPDMGKSDEWMKLDETYVEGTLSVWPLIFDGASVDFVLESGEDDTSLNSPHASANSLPFLLDDTKLLNNDFWWEATIGAPAISADAERYRGFAQFDLWLNRPSVLREAAIEHEDNASVMEHFVQLIDSVEMVHKSDILQDFWHNGTLVKNPNVTNPHDKNIPEMYRGELGWYMLDTDVQGVWAFALVKGEEPNREWLVFVQSGAEELPEALHVSIPEYQDVAVSVGKAGEFFLIDEIRYFNAKKLRVKNVPDSWPWHGFNVMLTDDIKEMDIKLISESGANMISLNFETYLTAKNKKMDTSTALAYDINRAKEILLYAKKYEIGVVLTFSKFPLDPTSRYNEKNGEFWKDEKNIQEILHVARLLSSTFNSYGDELLAYKIMGEPLDNKNNSTPEEWLQLMPKVVEEIRKNDVNRYVVLTTGPGGTGDNFVDFTPLKDLKIIYGFHSYRPHAFTHQGVSVDFATETIYPNIKKKWDGEYIRSQLQIVKDFSDKYHVPIFVGEFSAVHGAKGSLEYLEDSINVFNEFGFGWAYWVYNGWKGWNIHYTRDNTTEPTFNYVGDDSQRLDLLNRKF